MQNRSSVLPDYVAQSQIWQRPREVRSLAPMPLSIAASECLKTSVPVAQSMSSLSGLKAIVETSSCDLLFKQFGRSDKSEAEFTIRNINRSSFVVCRILPKRAIYTVTPSRTFLLPYPKKQMVKIMTCNNSPIKVFREKI